MDPSNVLITLAVMFSSLHDFSLGLSCLTCDSCDEEMQVPVGLECRGNYIYCISYVDNFKKMIKRCGTTEECGRVVNPSVDHNQFIANMKSFVNGSMEYVVATLDESSFRQNDSYCCDSDLCNSQTLNFGKYEVETVGVSAPLDIEGNHEGTTVGGLVNTNIPLEEYIEYSTTLRKSRHAGYNSPKLRSRLNQNTTTSVNSGVGEKRSMKRSPAAAEGNHSDNGDETSLKTEVTVIPNEEATFRTLIHSESSSISAETLSSSTIGEPTDSRERAEAVSNGVTLHCIGKYILILHAIVYIFW